MVREISALIKVIELTRSRALPLPRVVSIAVLVATILWSLQPVRPVQAASIIVNSLSDAFANDGICTLREAIEASNTNAIVFSAAGECPAGDPSGVAQDNIGFGVAGIINVGSPLPLLTDGRLTINGMSAGVPSIALNGAGAGVDVWGLIIQSPQNRLTGLVIHNFDKAAILIDGPNASDNIVAGNFLGTDNTGLVALPNLIGIIIQAGATNNHIGAIRQIPGNLISGNNLNGIRIEGLGTSGNMVAGNRIGTDLTGNVAVGNLLDGVFISLDASDNFVGTNGDGNNDSLEGNVISGNGNGGVALFGGAAQNVVAGNRIGVDINGTVALPNQGVGVVILFGANNNRIGTNGDGVSDSIERNIISGNASEGVFIGQPGTDNNVVAGNVIGTDGTGMQAIPNQSGGININVDSSFHLIGTDGDGVADLAERNLISGNVGGPGIEIVLQTTLGMLAGNVVAGNFIGTAIDGASALGNDGDGILVTNGALNTLIGTNGDGVADQIEGNVISWNTGHGINVSGPFTATTTGTQIAGNTIGTDQTMTLAAGNGGDGIFVSNRTASTLVGSNLDGISDPLEANLISANGGNGVTLDGGDSTLHCNRIGAGVPLALALPNTGDGVVIDSIASGAQTLLANGILHHAATNGVRLANNFITLDFQENGIQGNGTGFRNQSVQTAVVQQNFWGDPAGASNGVPTCPTLAGGAGDSVACDSGDIDASAPLVNLPQGCSP